MDTIKSVRKSILKFEDACEKRFLLCDVDSVFRRSYIKWLSDQGIKPNTIQTHLSTILTLMRKVMIPLDRRVKTILDKYNGVLPKVSELTFNKHIKTIAEIIGWTEVPLFELEKSDGDKNRRFCDMVFSHTARRTFATIAYSMGIPLASIMAVTGHSTEERLRTYLHLQAEDKAIIAAKDLDGFLRLRRRDLSSQYSMTDSNNIPTSETLIADTSII